MHYKKKLCLLIKETNIHKNCKKLEEQAILIVSLDWQDIYYSIICYKTLQDGIIPFEH